MQDGSSLPLIQALFQAQSDVWMLGTDTRLYQQTLQLLQSTLSPLGFPLAQSLQQLPIATDSIWSRDYGPLSTLPTPSYQGPELDYKLLNSFYYPDRRQDDRVPASLSRVLNSPLGPLSEKTVYTAQLSLALEGGNLMCTRQHCFATTTILSRNLGERYPNGRTLNSEPEIEAEFKAQLEQSMHFVPTLPGEATGHIDMWAKFLNENTLLIAELSDASLKFAETPEGLKEVQRFLDVQTLGKDAQGHPVADSLAAQARALNPALKIVRIPLPLPDYQGTALYRSYTNALLVNGSALLPRYRSLPGAQAYPDQSLVANYESAVEEAYRQADYHIRWIPSEDCQWGSSTLRHHANSPDRTLTPRNGRCEIPAGWGSFLSALSCTVS